MATSPAGAGRGAGHFPGLLESALNVGDDRPLHLDAGVAPRVKTFLGITFPDRSHAKAHDKGRLAVDRDHLAVIARHPAERAVEPGRIEAANMDARLPEPAPVALRGLAQTPQPVVYQPHLDSVPGALDQGVGKTPARRVVVDDVVFEVDAALGRGDRLQPTRVVFAGVAQQPDAVA